MMCVTHEMGFAKKVSHRVIFMDAGKDRRGLQEGRVLRQAPTRVRRAKDLPHALGPGRSPACSTHWRPHQMRARSAGARHITSPGRVPKALVENPGSAAGRSRAPRCWRDGRWPHAGG